MATTSPAPSTRQITLRILPAVAFTAVAYFSIGIPLAILPTYAHLNLGVGTAIAGLLVSLQYIATFASRPTAGRLSDSIGPKRTVQYGLAACSFSGILMLLSAMLHHRLALSLTALVLSRLALGSGESLSSTGSTMWGIGRVGHQHTARVISWNGVATYGALAISAPVGVAVEAAWGFGAVGIIILVLALVSLLATTQMAATRAFKAEHAPNMMHMLRGITPYGLALALGGVGFGIIATFVTLYFAHAHWDGAALSLTVYGFSFVGARLAFSNFIDQFGGFRITLLSLAIEIVGLVLLGAASSPTMAHVACGLTGLGFSLVFPALGVEAAKVFPISERGAVLGIYSAFVDFSLFITGPLAGITISHYGYRSAFFSAALAVIAAFSITLWLLQSTRSRAPIA